MVLHNLPNGAMRHLDPFLTEVTDRGGRFRQDFPPACTPITGGRVTGPLADFVRPASED
jgi:peptidoglycan-N-acetylglucosamine deacetylase